MGIQMKHVRPYSICGDQLLANQGLTVCPYCESQSTDDLTGDIGWVEGPILHKPPRFICLGCCEDIYSTCAADDFDGYPYHSIVEQAAEKEGTTVAQFRSECLKQQIRVAKERATREKTDKYNERVRRLEMLLDRINVLEPKNLKES